MKTLKFIIKFKFILILLLFLGCNDDKFTLEDSFEFELKSNLPNGSKVYYENINPLEIWIDPTRELKNQKYKFTYEVNKAGSFTEFPEIRTSEKKMYYFMPKKTGRYQITVNAWDGKENRSKPHVIEFEVEKEDFNVELTNNIPEISRDEKVDLFEEFYMDLNITTIPEWLNELNENLEYQTELIITGGKAEVEYDGKIINIENKLKQKIGNHSFKVKITESDDEKGELNFKFIVTDRYVNSGKDKSKPVTVSSKVKIRQYKWDYKAMFSNDGKSEVKDPVIYIGKGKKVYNFIENLPKVKHIKYTLSFDIEGANGTDIGELIYKEKAYKKADEISIKPSEEFNLKYIPKKGDYKQVLILTLKDNQGISKVVRLDFKAAPYIEVDYRNTNAFVWTRNGKTDFDIYFSFIVPPPEGSIIYFYPKKYGKEEEIFEFTYYSNKELTKNIRKDRAESWLFSGDVQMEIKDKKKQTILFEKQEISEWRHDRVVPQDYANRLKQQFYKKYDLN